MTVGMVYKGVAGRETSPAANLYDMATRRRHLKMLLTQADMVVGESMQTEKPGSQQISGERYDYY